MKILKKMSEESGQILPVALVMMLLGGLLVTPVLDLMTTNLNATRQIDVANLEVYAADAGVENMLWNIQYNQYDPYENQDGFTLPTIDGGSANLTLTGINNRDVDVTLSKTAGEPYYRITSTATDPTDGHQSTVESLIYGSAYYSWFFDAAITAAEDVTLYPGVAIIGDIIYGDDLDIKDPDLVEGETLQEPNLPYNWPQADYLIERYYSQVDDIEDPYPSNQIQIDNPRTNPQTIPRLRTEGPMEFKGAGWARLTGGSLEGIADTTSSYHLVDYEGGFDSTCVGGMVFNMTDNTTAEVEKYISSSTLEISNNIIGYGDAYLLRKSGLVYMGNSDNATEDGWFKINPTGGGFIDLNGQTIFAQFYNNCSNDAVYVGPNPYFRGSGSIIGIGNVKFNPHLTGAGEKLLGVDYTTDFPPENMVPANTVVLSRFQAEHGGKFKSISLLGALDLAGQNIKMAIYADGVDGPGSILGTDNATAQDSATIDPAVHCVNDSELYDIELWTDREDPLFDGVELNKGQYYWLAAVSDYPMIGYKSYTYPEVFPSKKKVLTEPQNFETWVFPENLTGLQDASDRQYLLSGNALPFVFIMSVDCVSTVQPQANFYGSIAGNAEVYLKPGTYLQLTEVPEDGLDFPNPGTGTSDDFGTTPIIHTYTINPQ